MPGVDGRCVRVGWFSPVQFKCKKSYLLCRCGSVVECADDRRAECGPLACSQTTAESARLPCQSSRLAHRGRRLDDVTCNRRSTARRPSTARHRPRHRHAQQVQLLLRGAYLCGSAVCRITTNQMCIALICRLSS